MIHVNYDSCLFETNNFHLQVCEKAPQFGNVPDSVRLVDCTNSFIFILNIFKNQILNALFCRSYMERSLGAAPAADHEKVMGYLEARLRPMLQSGSFKFINWDKEPLPHTKNYELNKQWTPAAKNLPKANPLASPEKKPQWAPPPKGTENRRRRRTSSSSPSESGRSSEKRGWYEDREARSPSIEITGETKVGVRAGARAGRGEARGATVENGAMFGVASSVELARVRDKLRLQFLSKKEKRQLLQREKKKEKVSFVKF